MNKQELIETLAKRISTLEDFRGISGFHDGNYAGLEYALNLIQQLDEQQKLILPKCAEQWIEGHCAPSDVVNLFIEVTCATDSDGFIDSKWRWSTDFYEWLANDADTLYILCDALRYGYEIEKEPRWIVKYIPPFVDEFRYYSMDDVNFDITESSWTSDKEDAYPFADKSKAEAVALLVDGSVEEV